MAYEVLVGGAEPAGERAGRAMWDVTTALDSGSGSVAVLGWPEVHEARVLPGARVLELGCAADWAALVAAHPRVVTATRQDDWFASTGRRGPWVIPDWQAVADRWDGVHLQVRGYLDAAGRAVPVPAAPGVPDGAATVLAGWSPDETWWLHPEAVERTGVAATWVRTQEDWAPLG